MKVLPFTIPSSQDRTILIEEQILPEFYPHLHRHEEIQLTLIIKGEGTLLVGNIMHPFKANEVYLIGADVPHVFKSDLTRSVPGCEQTVHALTIFFNPKGKLASLFDLPELKSVHTFFSSHHSGFRVPQADFTDIAGRIQSIQSSSGLDQLMQFFQLLRSLSALENIRALAPDLQLQTFSDYEGLRISNIYNYIMQHYQRDISLEEVAAAAFMTPQAFCRYFKKHTRVTFVTFLNEIRINEACKKLIEGAHSSVSAVAYECGFNSITNFNRVFKSTTGKSPRQYVSLFLNNIAS
jgi:AraC-like DNA-binding protein